jgi:hypothetical protein
MARPKNWFDKRAEDGFYWTVTVKREISYSVNSWSAVETLRYIPVSMLDAHPVDVRQYGKMAKDEAIAMAKLLNASETN